ncbi:integrase core domain-containing protein [Burkholderia cepacia]|uniref:integrase core domain-containing protein n=1 Tax=Burkholderia sp. BCC1977 TaxID=2817440 RepID=UPI0039F1C8CB
MVIATAHLKNPALLRGRNSTDALLPSRSHARGSIGQYIELYNRKRPHSSLADRTPDEAYFATLPAIKSAA